MFSRGRQLMVADTIKALICLSPVSPALLLVYYLIMGFLVEQS